VWHPKQDNDSAELEKSEQEWIIVYALVKSRMVLDALQEREIVLRGIADVYLVGEEIRCFYKTLKFIAVLVKSLPLDHIHYFYNIKNAKSAINKVIFITDVQRKCIFYINNSNKLFWK
jgi:hypothetical protein